MYFPVTVSPAPKCFKCDFFFLFYFVSLCVYFHKYVLNLLGLILFEKDVVKYYFVSANFVTFGGQAEVGSIPRGGEKL